MEHFYVTLLLIFVSFVTLSLFIIFYKHKAKYLSHSNLPRPPGHIGLPLIGETLEFLYTGWKGHPERLVFDRITRYSSQVFITSLLGEPTAVFCGAACNKFLFSNENKIVTAWWPDSVNKIFPSSLQTSSKDVADCWENKDEVVVLSCAKKYTFWLACRLFLSIEDPDHVAKLTGPFHLLASGIFSVPINFPGTPFNRGIKASNFIRMELLKIIRQRKVDLEEGTASPTQDILSHMLLTSDENGKFMNELDVADKILGLLIGGHDTASAACTFIVKYLAELPHVYDKVYKEQMEITKSKSEGEMLNWGDIQKMKYSWNVACAVMRLAPPLQGAFREAINDFIFNGFSIPKGWKLYWSANSTHKSSEYFPEPEKFDPSRFEGNGPAPYTFVRFGGGPRMCPGKEYARLEILVFIHHLVKRFKWEKSIPDEKIIVDPMPAPQNGLPVRLFPHKP